MHAPLGYIHDGYTRSAYIAARPRLHPELRFQYRPMLSQNRAVIFHQIAALEPDDAERVAAEAIRAQLVSWDLQDHTGSNVAITVANLLRVEPNLAVRLFQVVTGRDATDEDPAWSQERSDELADKRLARALSGATPESEERADVGNSTAGCN